MSLTYATWTLAGVTAILAIGAIVTAVYAIKAFIQQTEEVGLLQQGATDQQELTRQQAELLKVQSGQLEVQQQQLEEQRHLNARQAEVMDLQAQELQASLAERKQEAENLRRAQASQVFIWEERLDKDPRTSEAAEHLKELARSSGLYVDPPGVIVEHLVNTSPQPIYDVLLSWHKGSARWGFSQAIPALMPGAEEIRIRDLPSDLPEYVDPAVYGAVLFFRDAAGTYWRTRPDGQLDEIRSEQVPRI